MLSALPMMQTILGSSSVGNRARTLPICNIRGVAFAGALGSTMCEFMTCATLCVSCPGARRKPAQIGKLLGHTQLQTTARYAHLANESVKASGSRIADSNRCRLS